MSAPHRPGQTWMAGRRVGRSAPGRTVRRLSRCSCSGPHGGSWQYRRDDAGDDTGRDDDQRRYAGDRVEPGVELHITSCPAGAGVTVFVAPVDPFGEFPCRVHLVSPSHRPTAIAASTPTAI